MKCPKCHQFLTSKEDSVVVDWNGLGGTVLSQFDVYHKQCFENFKYKSFIDTNGSNRLFFKKVWNYVLLVLLGISPWFLILSQHIPLGLNLATGIFVIIDAIIIIMTVRSLIIINGFQKLPDTQL